jgi:hypothetical protein
VSDISSKGSESLYPSSSVISDFGIAPSIIYISSIKENADVTNPCGILVGCSCLYPTIENAKKG